MTEPAATPAAPILPWMHEAAEAAADALAKGHESAPVLHDRAVYLIEEAIAKRAPAPAHEVEAIAQEMEASAGNPRYRHTSGHRDRLRGWAASLRRAALAAQESNFKGEPTVDDGRGAGTRTTTAMGSDSPTEGPAGSPASPPASPPGPSATLAACDVWVAIDRARKRWITPAPMQVGESWAGFSTEIIGQVQEWVSAAEAAARAEAQAERDALIETLADIGAQVGVTGGPPYFPLIVKAIHGLQLRVEEAESLRAQREPQGEALRAAADTLRRWWSFDDKQMHTHSWHDREDYIDKELPALIERVYQVAALRAYDASEQEKLNPDPDARTRRVILDAVQRYEAGSMDLRELKDAVVNALTSVRGAVTP